MNKSQQAVNNVSSIIGPTLVGKDPIAHTEIDNFMVQQLDGTKNEWGWCKQKLGANAILAVSLAVCKAEASIKKSRVLCSKQSFLQNLSCTACTLMRRWIQSSGKIKSRRIRLSSAPKLPVV